MTPAGYGAKSADPLPRWMTLVGWVGVAGCAVFSAAVGSEIIEVGDLSIVAGISDYFFPGPRALSMLIWGFSHIWALVLLAALARRLYAGHGVRFRDAVLTMALTGGVILGRVLLYELAVKGVRIAIPGIIY